LKHGARAQVSRYERTTQNMQLCLFPPTPSLLATIESREKRRALCCSKLAPSTSAMNPLPTIERRTGSCMGTVTRTRDAPNASRKHRQTNDRYCRFPLGVERLALVRFVIGDCSFIHCGRSRIISLTWRRCWTSALIVRSFSLIAINSHDSVSYRDHSNDVKSSARVALPTQATRWQGGIHVGCCHQRLDLPMIAVQCKRIRWRSCSAFRVLKMKSTDGRAAARDDDGRIDHNFVLRTLLWGVNFPGSLHNNKKKVSKSTAKILTMPPYMTATSHATTGDLPWSDSSSVFAASSSTGDGVGSSAWTGAGVGPAP